MTEDENLAGDVAPETATGGQMASNQEGAGDGNASAGEEKQDFQQRESSRNYTQEQVNEIVRGRLERASKALYDRYGVGGEKELDELVGMAQAYQTMKSRYDAMLADNKSLKEQIMFHANAVLPEREDDVRTYFKGKGLEMSDEALKQVLISHPEWLAQASKPAPTTTIVPLGGQAEDETKPDPEAEAAKMFGLSHFVN